MRGGKGTHSGLNPVHLLYFADLCPCLYLRPVAYITACTTISLDQLATLLSSDLFFRCSLVALHSSACLAMLSSFLLKCVSKPVSFSSSWLVHYGVLISFLHNSSLVRSSSQCTLTIPHKHLLIKTCSLPTVVCETSNCSRVSYVVAEWN